jgi:RHS repeat-associated protein
MHKNRQISYICRKKHKSRVKTDDSITQNPSCAHNVQSQRVFKTAPLFAVTNPDPAAAPSVLAAFTAFFESLWDPASATTAAQKAGMSYVYDETGTLIADTLTGGATTTWGQSARYIYLPTASGPMPVAAIYGTKHYAIQSDHLNTPRRLVQSDGQVAWQWAYSAFGDEQPTVAKNRFANTALNQSFGSTTVAAVTFNLRYPGQYFDQESNLHYNLNRSYDTGRGRYTQADPIGLDGGWNRYSYVGQNPLGFTDPLGLWSVTLGGYAGPGAQVTFGNDNGNGFFSLRVGFGLGGGGTWNPIGGMPGGSPNDPSGGFSLQCSGKTAFNAGLIQAGLEGGANRNYNSEVSSMYGTNSGSARFSNGWFGGDKIWGINANGNFGASVTVYGGKK